MARTLAQFWEAIELIDRSAVRNDPNDSRAVATLAAFLESRPVSPIESLEERLSRVLYEIDGEQYCSCTIRGSPLQKTRQHPIGRSVSNRIRLTKNAPESRSRAFDNGQSIIATG